MTRPAYLKTQVLPGHLGFELTDASRFDVPANDGEGLDETVMPDDVRALLDAADADEADALAHAEEHRAAHEDHEVPLCDCAEGRAGRY